MHFTFQCATFVVDIVFVVCVVIAGVDVVVIPAPALDPRPLSQHPTSPGGVRTSVFVQ